MAVTAAQRLGRTPRFVHLDSTSFHLDGRYNSGEEPDTSVIHITRGYSRDHRSDLNQVMLDLLVEHQTGIPLLMQPLSGDTSDGSGIERVITEPVARLHTTDGTTYLVADNVPYSAENLHKLAQTGSAWITRGPAALTAAQTAFVQATPVTARPLMQGYRNRVLASTYGGVASRRMLIYSAYRRPQAHRTVDKQLLKQSTDKPKPSRNSAAGCLYVKPMRKRHSAPLGKTCRRLISISQRSTLFPTLRSGDSRATQRFRTKWCTRSKGRWPLPWRAVRP